MNNKLYFKVLNEQEEEGGVRFKKGYNSSKEEIEIVKGIFPYNKEINGGITFTDDKFIGKILYKGPFIREVKQSIHTIIAIKQNSVYKDYRAENLNLGKRRDFRKKETWKWLKKKGVDIQKILDDGIESIAHNGFNEGCNKKQLEYFNFLIGLGANIENRVSEIFKWACSGGNINIVKFIFKKYNLQDKWFEYTIVNDVISGLKTEVEFEEICEINEKNVKPYLVDIDGESKEDFLDNIKTAFNYACYEHLDIVKFLFEETKILFDIKWPLLIASGKGQLDIVKFLLKNGADIHFIDDEALTKSCEAKGNVDVVKYLIKQGADIFSNNHFARDNSPKTPLATACYYNKKEIVKFLLKKMNGVINEIENVIYCLRDVDISKLILEEINDNNLLISFSRITSIRGDKNISKLLFEIGFDINSANGLMLKTAIKSNNFEYFKFLLDNGADIKYVNSEKFLKHLEQRGDIEKDKKIPEEILKEIRKIS